MTILIVAYKLIVKLRLCKQRLLLCNVRNTHASNNKRIVLYIGQGEARHRKYKKLKLGGGQPYDRSSD
jgi:hypothetical protein